MKTVLTITTALAIALAAGAASAGNVVWLETEHFDDLGGWTNDAQFVDQMGSPFLLAIGLEKPVGDATTTAAIPAAGKYRLWVRAHDWTPEHSPGRFQVGLGDKLVEHVFGRTKTKGWLWEDGGVHELPAGRLKVRLHDLTGHYGRCDAIVLCDDPGYRPPGELAALAAERETRGGVSREVERLEPFNTVVVGGGLAGTFAAVASARSGSRTVLVQNRPVLGGNGSTEVLVRPEGDTTREPLDPGEGGIIEEVRGDVEGYSERMLKLVQAEPNLKLHLNTHATGVEMAGPGRIAAVLALDVTTGQRLAIPGRTFIDCTGDGAIGVWAGAEHRHGREPRSMYNETRAPEQGDLNSGTMGGTLRYATQAEAAPVAFTAPPWARKFTACSDFNEGRHPQLQFGGWQWVIEYGGQLDTYADAEEIRDELLRIIWGMWDHAKNHCSRLSEEGKNYRLTWVSHVVGKRESRRLIGDYVMTEHDVANMVLFPDRVSYCGWGIDLHPPGGFYDKEPPATFSHKVKFSVPLRSLYSKDVENLLMAGRCISVSHVALGATRVMITCGLQGQAAGTAAAVANRHQTTPRGVYESHLVELQQQLLKDGCYLIDLPNQDPRDLALAAAVTASSEAPPASLKAEGRLAVHPLGCDRAVMFKVANERIDRAFLYLHSENQQPTKIKLGLRSAPALGDFAATTDLAAAEAVVPSKSEGWVKFPLTAAVQPGYYYVWLPRTPGLSWSLFETQPPDTARAYRGQSEWNRMPDCYAFRLDPPLAAQPKLASREPEEGMFAAANVTNGYAWAIRGQPHSWRPDPAQPLPQWVELDFGREVRFNQAHVSFQSKALRADDFRLEVPQGDGWRSVAQVAGNTDRRHVLGFEPVTAAKLRLVVVKAQDDMGVCEIRVYDEPEPPAGSGN